MTLRDLEYVCAVADHGHFGKAALACHVSQPTLSGQIRKLEDELGVVLFERSSRSVRLTPVGEEIVALGRGVLRGADEIAETARARRDPSAGTLRVGLIPTIAPYLIPLFVGPLHRRFPALRPVLVEDITENLLARLQLGSLDAAIIATNPESGHLHSFLLYREPFLVALPRAHALARRGTVNPSDLDRAELLLLADGHCFRDQALEVCGATSETDRPDTTATSLETIVNLVAAGYGVTLMPALAVRDASPVGDDVVLRPTTAPDASRVVRLVYRARFPQAAILEQMAVVIRDEVPAVVERL